MFNNNSKSRDRLSLFIYKSTRAPSVSFVTVNNIYKVSTGISPELYYCMTFNCV